MNSEEVSGALPSARAGALRAEPATQSQAKPLVPNASDLELCPFDGQPADVEHLENGRWSVGCQNEDCIGYMSRTTFARKAEAVAGWNTRFQAPANAADAPKVSP